MIISISIGYFFSKATNVKKRQENFSFFVRGKDQNNNFDGLCPNCREILIDS